MAPETRSRERLNELEKRMGDHTAEAANSHARLDQNTADISDIKFSMSQIQSTLKELVAGVASLTTQNQGDANGGSTSSQRSPPIQFGSYGAVPSYLPPTKHTRVEFPRFDGSDFRGWSYRCHQFFAVDSTPPEQHIRLISIHLEGKALKWHLNLLRTSQEEE